MLCMRFLLLSSLSLSLLLLLHLFFPSLHVRSCSPALLFSSSFIPVFLSFVPPRTLPPEFYEKVKARGEHMEGLDRKKTRKAALKVCVCVRLFVRPVCVCVCVFSVHSLFSSCMHWPDLACCDAQQQRRREQQQRRRRQLELEQKEEEGEGKGESGDDSGGNGFLLPGDTLKSRKVRSRQVASEALQPDAHPHNKWASQRQLEEESLDS